MEWFEASGPLDPCHMPAGLVISEDFDSKHAKADMKRKMCQEVRNKRMSSKVWTGGA